MVGGMVSSTVLTLLVIPAIYSLWKEWEVRRVVEAAPDPGVERASSEPTPGAKGI
jgi:Cu(I)/Ag(I) efflux system membrane protein CusA/SilA